MTPSPRGLGVVLVDVSGRGSRAAARSMHLSGASALLLGSVPAEAFPSAANDCPVGLGQEDEFATAVHPALRPVTGHYRLFNAGHPPTAHHTRRTAGRLLRAAARDVPDDRTLVMVRRLGPQFRPLANRINNYVCHKPAPLAPLALLAERKGRVARWT